MCERGRQYFSPMFPLHGLLFLRVDWFGEDVQEESIPAGASLSPEADLLM